MVGRRVAVTVGMALFGVAVPLVGQEDGKPRTTAFTADLGFVSAAGNTSVTTMNFGDRLVLKSLDKTYIFTQVFSAVRSEADGRENAENYRGHLRFDFGLGRRVYLFGLTGWERNVPGGIARRFEETFGLALKPVATSRNQLDVEMGISLVQQRNTELVDDQPIADDFVAGRVAGTYKHTFAKATTFTQQIELIPNFDIASDFRVNTESAVVAPISNHLAVKLGYVIRYDHLPGFLPEPNPRLERFRKTDRFLTAGLTISY